jgi:protein Tex
MAGADDSTLSEHYATAIAGELQLPERGVRAVLRLTAEGATVPFLARYRKEATGGLDEVQIRTIAERGAYLTELDARRRAILSAIGEQGALTAELEAALQRASTKTELEDLYLPYKPKRRTRASIAKERGLEPLANQLWNVDTNVKDQGVLQLAARFVDAARDVPDVQSALSGARDICAERLAELPQVRQRAREEVKTSGVLRTTKLKAHRDVVTKFDAYASFSEPLARLAAHRLLAITRGQTEGVLKAKIDLESARLERWAQAQIPANKRQLPDEFARQLSEIVSDAVTRLILPSAENDVESELLSQAHNEATAVFASNLRNLLLAPPLGGKRILAIDPGQRTGCKLVMLSETGQLVDNTVIHLVQGAPKTAQAVTTLRGWLTRYRPEAIAVGNGTHGRETERFVRDVLREHPADNVASAFVVSVNEAGASVYSASDVAREEFPDYDVTVRGAVSIGRRLQDPLAELVKIEPKSIGVGQYQHDVNQKQLEAKLSDVVESCVNEVGVELNTASAPLLSYVAGVGKKAAHAMVQHRDQHGAFASRQELLKVKGIGPKVFEQCAGFLRIRGATNPLDASAVHPERYKVVQQIAADLGVGVKDLLGNSKLLKTVDPTRYKGDGLGELTLNDILAELAKPGRDPRAHFEAPHFDETISSLADLTPGMFLEGVVTNVTAFGAFVDVGVHQDGLVHVSHLAHRFIKDPTTVVSVGDKLKVQVLEVDMARKRISLSAKNATPRSA